MKKKGKTPTIIDDIPAVIDGSSSRRNKKRVFQGLLLLDGYRLANWTTKRHDDYKRSFVSQYILPARLFLPINND